MTRETTSLEATLSSFQEADELLMVRLMDGDRQAFDRLYERYETRIRTFVHRFVGDWEAALDLTQEVFLKVYRNPSAFDPRGRFLTWIFAVARNASIDYLRLKRLPVSASVGSEDDEDDRAVDIPTPRQESPERGLLLRELREKIHEVLARLSTKLREVFILCAVQGLSYEEASEIIGCPVKTVSSRLSRARDQFFQSFQSYLDEGVTERRP